MAFRRRSGTSWVTPSKIMRRSGSSWVEVDTIRRRSGTSWITVYQSYQALSITATPVIIHSPQGFVGATGGTSTTRVTGGKGTLTYRWTLRSGTALLSGSSTSSTAYFRHDFGGRSGERFATYRVTVTDGISSAYADISIALTYGTPL